MDATQIICDALARGELGLDDLTARRLGAYLGKTTSVLYHHWGSLDGFLFGVAQRGFERLGEVLARAASGATLADVAEAYVRFGLDHPTLYALMLERRYDWDGLRRAGAFEQARPSRVLWQILISRLAAAGAVDPDGDARILFAAVHGLVSLALSGRANAGALDQSDEEVAVTAARKLALRLCPHPHQGDLS
ncbi:TetR/AcrR family transcriptional regulator [Haliangium sp.]|uniref:TetR/AcrR family transcriptional regulator n=1 Tax=Haliangium sp. TaxID=2663208 RepID=UPI003D0B029F